MDTMRDFGDGDAAYAAAGEVSDGVGSDAAIEAPPAIGTDERRMHVRAYNQWVAMLGGRAYPCVEDLDPAANGDLGPHSVLLDFTRGAERPAIAYLGARLREECGLSAEPDDIDDVPPRSLLSRLTDHYLQIIANRAPIGFEAEFVNTRGNNTAYRGILMPFSSDDDTIDFIYGVINWKEVAGVPEALAIEAEIGAALAQHAPRTALPAWADGPHATSSQPQRSVPDGYAADEIDDETGEDFDEVPPAPDSEALADWLATARSSADAVKHADSRGRAALYHALGQAYDFAVMADSRDEEYRELLADTGLVAQARAPMTPIVKLIFGHDYDKTRLTEFAAALSYGKRHALPKGAMRLFLDQYPGGLKAVVAAERRERNPQARTVKLDVTREAARALEAQAVLTLPGDDEFVVLVARRIDAERVAVIGVVPEDSGLLDRALRHIIPAA